MSPKRTKTASQIISDLIKKRKSNSPKKIKLKNNTSNDFIHHSNNDNAGLNGQYYLQH
jgi:hypothetical protein